jgi:hypothetical protein
MCSYGESLAVGVSFSFLGFKGDYRTDPLAIRTVRSRLRAARYRIHTLSTRTPERRPCCCRARRCSP